MAAVCLVGDHHNVAPIRQQRMPVALLLGEELLDGGEHHSAGFHPELFPKVGPALRLDGGLPQQVGATRKGGEELVVEVVAVRQHDEGGILHRRLAHNAAGVEHHGQTLARPLGMPDNPDASVAPFSTRPVGFLRGGLSQRRRPQGFPDRGLHRMELVVAGGLLDQRTAAVVFEHGEIADERQEPVRRADPLDQDLELGPFRDLPHPKGCARA